MDKIMTQDSILMKIKDLELQEIAWKKEFDYNKNHPSVKYRKDMMLSLKRVLKSLYNAKKEVFDDIRNKFNSKHQCSSCDYGIMEFELRKLEKENLSKS